ncbi:MAG: dihydroorotate dehydrogenase electron transfer subunit [Candidatus Omnitrophica bacterium]|nr:dihydroorotate dehydrogenase electron transfer subunit [Candidatus Omnitrophota bacterium]
MIQVKAKLIYNKKIKNNYFCCALFVEKLAYSAYPGQFLQIKIDNGYTPFLRRPFSIHRLKGKNIEILYEVVGKGTEILSKKKPGEYLDVIGPLGNGFNLNIPYSVAGISILVGGGIGVAPLLFLAERLVHNRQSKVHRGPCVLIGAKNKRELLCEKEFQDLGCEVRISTDDGSKGFKGKVTDLLKVFLQKTNQRQGRMIYACGPRPMLKEIAVISQKYSIPAEVCLEEHMACGIGVCLGCVVNTKRGYKRVCKDGPVFKTEEIIW